MTQGDLSKVDLTCCGGGGNGANEIPFCCVQVVPGNLEVDKCKLKCNDIELTFTPKLACCEDKEDVTCNIGGATCEIEAHVIKLVGCIEYALSTKNNRDPISGDFGKGVGANAVAACCSGIVCVNNIIACGENSLECPENICEILEEIDFKLNDAKVEKCPKRYCSSSETSFNNACPDKKIIKFTGKFILPTLPLETIGQ